MAMLDPAKYKELLTEYLVRGDLFRLAYGPLVDRSMAILGSNTALRLVPEDKYSWRFSFLLALPVANVQF